ncbi:hypothetical protein [Streptomyces xanthochromogenes]|uniref:hypothetical protein n=1 Tax=Streptomyces xanthochromogenes TaxID=67384 RepID=UPI003439D3D0
MNHGTRIASAVIATVTATALLAGIAPAAMASDGPSRAERTAGIAEQATGTADITPTTQLADGTQQAVTDTGDGLLAVTAPATASGSISATGDGITIGIALPATSDVKGIKTESGTIVYPGAAKNTDLAIQATDDGGVRSLITINNANAAKEYRFPLDLPAGAVPEQQEDGSVLVLTGADEDADIIGAFDAPWAKGANGSAVPTSYRIEDGTLIQTVAFDQNTAFPVVADPWWNPSTWNWKKIIKKTGSWVKARAKKCGIGALSAYIPVQAHHVSVNIQRARNGLRLVKFAGGPWGYVSVAAAGCLVNQLT